MQARPIAVLPDHVIDQIAAGEVIERPASVVKELVENALDAGAASVSIEIEGGGIELIRVIDDGIGMAAGDVEVALRRHATSKLQTIDDLYRLDTLGFRGEALPSIASVSRMAITTRARGAASDQPAVRVELDAGRVTARRDVGAPVGTTIEVRDLLFNVPARRKFLKGEATETSHVADAVAKLAMAHPGVHFRLRNRSRLTLDAPPHTSQLERARCLLGTRIGARLFAEERQEGDVRVAAFVAAPELAQTTARGTQLYVGRRPVRDRGLLHAVVSGYGELMPRGRYPVAVIAIDVGGGAVDVNVHPQKLEVRFADAQAVYAAVRHTVTSAVASAPWVREPLDGQAPVRMEVIAERSPEPYAARQRMVHYRTAAEARLTLPWARKQRPLATTPLPLSPVLGEGSSPHPQAEERASARAAIEVAQGFFSELRYIGQLDRTYLVCEAAGELVLIDQHAAHERVQFQRLRERYKQQAVPVQRLLFPHRVELDPGQSAAATDVGAELAAVGFELEPFGGPSFAIKAVPAGLRGEPGAVLGQLLDELADCAGSRAVEERLDSVFATIACHSVVRAGDVLGGQEVEALLQSMDGVDYRAHCPHGRPVLLRIGIGEIARRFGR